MLLDVYCEIYVFQCYGRRIVKPGICFTVGSGAFGNTAKSRNLYSSRCQQWISVIKNWLQLSGVCRRTDSEKVGYDFLCAFCLFFFLYCIFVISDCERRIVKFVFALNKHQLQVCY